MYQEFCEFSNRSEKPKNRPCRHGQNFKILGQKSFGSFMVSNDRALTPEDRLLVQSRKMMHSLSDKKNFVSLVLGPKNKKIDHAGMVKFS